MRVCFHHQDFDVDVSSGTSHALYQWFELLQAFGIKECAIINQTDDVIPVIGDMLVHEYRTIDDFMAAHPDVVMADTGGKSHREFDFTDVDWIVFGGTHGLPRADVGISSGALYPREAAAIIISEASWQQH
jgi:hypothetical protein